MKALTIFFIWLTALVATAQDWGGFATGGSGAPTGATDTSPPFYIDTDTDDLYVYDGLANWFLAGPGAGLGGDEWGDPVDATITPDADGTRDLATTGTRFATGFFDNLDVTNQILADEVSAGNLIFTEKAAASAPTAGEGEVWLKNDTPNTLWFTDDAGTDHQIATGGGSGLVEWTEDGSGNLTPNADDAQDIGSGTNRVDSLWVTNILLAADGHESIDAVGGDLRFGVANGIRAFLDASQFRVTANTEISWNDAVTANGGTGPDVRLWREAAGHLIQRDGSNAQQLSLANNYTDASNYESLTFRWSANDAFIETEDSGTGTARSLFIRGQGLYLGGSHGSNHWRVHTSGDFFPQNALVYDLGGTSNRVETLYSGQSLTGSETDSAIDIETTWNTTGAPRLIDVAVTNTASDADSRLMNFNVDGTDVIYATPAGELFVQELWFEDHVPDNRMYIGSNGLVFEVNNIDRVQVSSTANDASIQLRDSGSFGWAAGSSVASDADTALFRPEAGHVQLRDLDTSTNPTALTIANTYTDASNFETGGMSWKETSNVFEIGSFAAGTGANRTVKMVIGGSDRMEFTTAATISHQDIRPNTEGSWDLGSTSFPWKTGYFGDSLTGAEDHGALDLSTTWNTTGTPTLIFADVTDTASNAASSLIDLQVGGSSVLKTVKDGTTTIGNYVLAGDQTVGAGQDDYVLTYDNGTGEISLEAAAGGGGAAEETFMLTIDNVTDGMDYGIVYFDAAFTVSEIRAVHVGSGLSSPDVSIEIFHSTDRSAAGNAVETTPMVITSETTGNSFTSGFEDATIPADSWVWIETSSTSGTTGNLEVVLRGDYD